MSVGGEKPEEQKLSELDEQMATIHHVLTLNFLAFISLKRMRNPMVRAMIKSVNTLFNTHFNESIHEIL